MELQVEVRPEFYSDEINKMLALKKKLGGVCKAYSDWEST